MALLSIFRGTQAECSARPVSDGTLLFATDTKKIYLDKDSSRIEMSSVDDLGNYVTKEQLTTALNGKANTTHTHTQDQITGLKDALAGKASTSHSHSAASSSMSGFMSAADKQKLDGIAAGANKYTLPAASSTALGGMKIGYKESGKNYSVKLDDNNQAYVTVPWTDTTSTDTNTTYTLTKSGSTITLEGSDGSSTAVNDDNTTYSLGSFGITATATELNYVDGVTSNVQTQLNKKQDKMKTVTIPSSGKTNKNKWIKFATIDMSSAPAWTACTGTLSFCNNNPANDRAPHGFLNFSLTTGGTAGTITRTGSSLVWVSLSSNSYAKSVADVKFSNGKYDIYYKPIMDDETVVVSLIDCTNTNYFTFNIGSWVNGITATTISKVNSYADSAGSVSWGNVSGKPATYPPSSHTHDDRYYTESEVDSKLSEKANSSHTHTKSQITDFPSSMKNPNSLTISLNGTSQIVYDGSAGKSINVTPTSIGAAASSHNHNASNITSGTLSADRIPTITDGKIQSVSASKITGTIPQSILPSYVDDVLEYENLAAFPKTGESGKIYVADDTNKTYRWSGTAYVEISASLALGTTSSTAFRGDYGNTAYAHAQAKGSAFSSGLYKITTNSQGHVTAATAVTKSDITALGIPGSDTNTNTTYSLSKSGSTITLKGSDGSTTSVTDADTNTTYPTFTGATTSAAGSTGLVPAPATGAANRYLRSDGTWQVPPDNNTTYPNMGGASSNAAGHAGLVPAPAAGASNRYLRSDGTWSVPPDNNTNTTYSLSKNGSTITLTGSDGSKTSVTDSNTTYSLSSFGVNASAAELNYVKGVTSSIQTQLNSKAASSHNHSAANITSGTLSTDRLPTVPIGRGGTGATDAAQARANIGAAAAGHTHTKSQITDFPSSLKNPNSLTISLNGTSQGAYDGSSTKSINITPSSIGAATSGHTHNYAGADSAGGAAKEVKNWGNASENVARHVWFSNNGADNQRVYNDNFKYNPVGNTVSCNISGTANVANYLNGTVRYVTQNSVDKPYWRCLKVESAKTWFDSSIILCVDAGYENGGFGILAVRLRNDNVSESDAATHGTVQWLCRYGYEPDQFILKIHSAKATTGYADLYFHATGTYNSCNIRILANSTRGGNGSSWQLMNDEPRAAMDTRAYNAQATGYDVGKVAYASSAGSANSVPWNGVSGKPSSMKNPNSLTISLNGTSQGAYDGSAAKSINVTPANIGAAAANHSHSNYLTTSGTAAAASKLATARTISLAGDVTGSANFDGSANISITSNIAAGTVGTNELASNAVTNAKIAADSVSLAKLGSDVGTVAVQSSEPSDTNVKLWIQI